MQNSFQGRRRARTTENLEWVCPTSCFCFRTDCLFRDRNWLEFLSVLDSTFAQVSSQREDEITQESKNECLENVSKARAFLAEVAEKDGTKNRAAPLALLELEHRACKFGLSGWFSAIEDFMHTLKFDPR